MKKRYTLPRPMMENADVARIINSDEVQSVLRPKLEAPKLEAPKCQLEAPTRQLEAPARQPLAPKRQLEAAERPTTPRTHAKKRYSTMAKQRMTQAHSWPSP